MINYILFIYIVLTILGLIFFIHEVKNAKEVNPRDFFLHDDAILKNVE